jgi:Flp pilus assembly CpaE family ATPase
VVNITAGSLRLALAIADPALEGALVVALQQTGATVDRYLAGDTLLAALRSKPVDAVLLDTGLNRVTPAVVRQVAGSGVPLLILAKNSQDETWAESATAVFDYATDNATLAQAFLSAARQRKPAGYVTASARRSAGEASIGSNRTASFDASAVQSSGPTGEQAQVEKKHDQGSRVVAVAAASGGVGCTTVAINLCIALGAVRRSVLVDLDLAHPCIAAYVAADILRNLAMLTRNEPGSPEHWRQALDGELQALDGRCPQAQLLLAIPDSSRGAAISAPFFERALPALQEGAGDGHIFIDLGGDLLRPDAATQRAALLAADQILLVARADSVSLWQAREAAAAWQQQIGVSKERLALVVTHYDGHIHQSPAHIGWNVGVPVAALVPNDRRYVERAVAAQRALLFERRSQAGRALLELADRLYSGNIILPAEVAATTRWWRLPWGRPATRHEKAEGVAGEPGVVVG